MSLSINYIELLNKLDPPPLNKYDKGGHTLMRCMSYYGVNSLGVLSEVQLEEFYNMELKRMGVKRDDKI